MPGTGSSIKESSLILKPASTVLANDNTVNDDPHLLFPIASSETLSFVFSVIYDAGAGGMRVTLNGPAGFVTLAYSLHLVNDVGNTILSGNQSAAWGAEIVLAGAHFGLALAYLYVVNGVNAGNVVFQWAQQVANPANTVVRLGSRLHVSRL